jgi:hypothetical protein
MAIIEAFRAKAEDAGTSDAHKRCLARRTERSVEFCVGFQLRLGVHL